MKIEDILNHIIYVSNNEKCCCELEKEEAKVLLDYITTLQRKEYNNSKAKKFIEEKISSTQGVINDYIYHKEHNKILIELLREDIELYKKELNILEKGE